MEICRIEDPSRKIDPVMTVFRDKCLIMTTNATTGVKKAQYMNENLKSNGYLMNSPEFALISDPKYVLVNLLYVEGDYVLAVYETYVQIFNAATGDLLQQIAIPEEKSINKFKLKMAAVNIANTEIYLVSRNIKESSKDQTEVYLLKEITVDEQIKHLLFACRIAEARELFNLRGNKNPEKFDLKRKKFNLDAAWQLLRNTTDYNQIVTSFN